MFPHSDLKFNHNLNHPNKTCFLSFLSLSDFKYRKWSNQDLNIGPICYAPTTTDCHRIWAGVFGTLNTGLHNPTLCQPSTWDGREWWGMAVGRFHVHVCSHGCFNKSNLKNVFLQQHWPWTLWGRIPLFLFPCQMKHRAPSLEKKGGRIPNQNQQLRAKHLWRWPAHGKGQRGSISLVTAPGWRRRFQHTLFCKRHSHIVCL